MDRSALQGMGEEAGGKGSLAHGGIDGRRFIGSTKVPTIERIRTSLFR